MGVMRAVWGLALVGVSLAAAGGPASGAPPKKAPKKAAPPARNAAAARAETAINRGLDYLRSIQERDGSWRRYPGITAVCVMGFLRNGVSGKDPVVARACDYLAGLAKPNGAIYTDQLGPAQALPNYNTALAMTALHLSGSPKYRETIRRAQQFLSASQFDEGEGFSPKDRQYGGIGYGSREDNPDVSNLQNALEALRETGYPKNAEVFKKALLFLQRCQNRKESNDQAWAGTDGGFVYASSGESKADEYTRSPHSSYGSMTYAGLKSYLYCSVDRGDARVRAARDWLRANYDAEQNPRMGNDGLYYYYHTMSKTLAVWGEKVVTDTAGKKHAWGADLVAALTKRQKPDGSWTNTNARWRENDPALVTGYALISLANAKTGL